MTLFRAHFEIADTGERLSSLVNAETPEDAKAQVQKTRGGVRLIWHKVKIDREQAVA